MPKEARRRLLGKLDQAIRTSLIWLGEGGHCGEAQSFDVVLILPEVAEINLTWSVSQAYKSELMFV